MKERKSAWTSAPCVFATFNGKTVLEMTGNYYVVYPRDRMDANERIRQTLPLESSIVIAHAYYTHLLITLQWFRVVLSGTPTRSLMILSGLVGGSIVGICINQGRI